MGHDAGSRPGLGLLEPQRPRSLSTPRDTPHSDQGRPRIVVAPISLATASIFTALRASR